jgi:hypothetical protein
MYGMASPGGRIWTRTGNWWNTDGKFGSFSFKPTIPNSFTGAHRITALEKDFGWQGGK